MNDDTRWLARLGIDQGLFTHPQCLQVCSKIGASADLMSFAQEFIDSGIVTEVEKLETIAGIALSKAEKGPPADDPFATQPDATPPSADAAGGFKFDSIAKLDDAALATAMRVLLKATAQHGASDLHLSTGARPFIRQHRILSYISEHTLTAADALRVNTALLSEGQKKIFLERKDYDYALALSGSDRYRARLHAGPRNR